jgi:hypothetical protein
MSTSINIFLPYKAHFRSILVRRGSKLFATWVVNLGYYVFVGMPHHMTSKINPMGLNWPSSSSYSGGCHRKSSEWEDPPTGPTYYFSIESV